MLHFSTRGIYGSSVGEVEVTFLTRPGSIRVILEIDRKARGAMSLFSSSHDDIVAFEVSDEEALRADLALSIDNLIRSRVGFSQSRGGFDARLS